MTEQSDETFKASIFLLILKEETLGAYFSRLGSRNKHPFVPKTSTPVQFLKVLNTDILKAVSEYSKNRGVAEETVEIPVDMSLMDYDAIRQAIEHENELGSKAGFTIKGSDGEGDDLDVPEDPNEPQTNDPQQPGDNTGTNPPTEPKDTTKDAVKQFRSYYARILFFAFLTKDEVVSLEDIVNCIDTPINIRIATNLGIHKPVLKAILEHADKFVLRKLDYKIQNLNQLSHDETVDPIVRASVSVQKFGKLGESEVITPQNICKDMIDMISDDDLKNVIENGNKILDIAGKAGEFALALCKRYFDLGYDILSLKDMIYTIPTSSVTYEFTRMIYEILGLNVNNIASKINSYSLLKITDDDGNIYYTDCKSITPKQAI